MPRAHPITGIRSLTSKTWFNQPPVEWGRAGGSVATIAVGTATGENGTGSGTNGTVDNKATTTDGGGSGLKVDLTIASNVCTAIAVDADAAACVAAIGPQVQTTGNDIKTMYQGDIIVGRLAMGCGTLTPAAAIEIQTA